MRSKLRENSKPTGTVLLHFVLWIQTLISQDTAPNFSPCLKKLQLNGNSNSQACMLLNGRGNHYCKADTKTGINFNWQSMTELQRSMLNPCVDETFSEEFSCSLLVLMTFSQPSVADILISAAEWRWGCCSWSWQCCYFVFLKGPLKIPFELLCFCMISIIVVCFCIKEKSSVKCGKLLKSSQPEATLTPKPTTVTSG